MSEKYQEMKEAAEGEETKTSVKESLEEKTDTEGTRSQEESEANDAGKTNSVTKGKEEISMSKDILKADVSGEKSSTEKDVEVPMSQSEEDILDIDVSVTDNEGNEEIPMSQDFSSSQTDVDMNSQDPDGKQKEEL